MNNIFLIEFLLLAGLLLVWIAYEYNTAKKLSEQSKRNQSKVALSGSEKSERTPSKIKAEQTSEPTAKHSENNV